VSDDLERLWQTGADGPSVDLADLRKRARTIDRQVRNRNLREVLVAGFLVAVFGNGMFRLADRPVSAAGLALLALGCAVVAIWILLRGTGPTSAPEAPTDRFLVQSAAELRYQARLLRSVPLWYVGPLVPGMLLFVGDSFVHADSAHRLGVGLYAASVPVVFGVVIWLNLHAARKLTVEADALEAITDRTTP
jgi:hypothetical protein